MKTIIDNLEFNGALIQFTQSDDFDTMINATELLKWVNYSDLTKGPING